MLITKDKNWLAHLENILSIFVVGFSVWLTYRVLAWRANYHVENDLMGGDAPSFWRFDLWPQDQINALLHGIYVDFIFMTVIAIILGLFAKWFRKLVILGLIIFLAANVEHIKYNFSNIRLDMLGVGMSPTFLSGSITPALIKYIIYMLFTAGITLLILKWRTNLRSLVVSWLLIVSMGAFAVPSPEPYLPDWTYNNPFIPINNDKNIPVDSRIMPENSLLSELPETSDKYKYNLVMVFVESLSTSSIARGGMVNLETYGENGISFDNFIGRQIITANGLYASFTGDTPSFLRRAFKWDQMKDDSPVVQKALPKILSHHGYQSLFLQAADLEFMDKKKHLTSLGFDEVYGNEHWKEAYSRNGWGVDDVTLMEGGLATIDTLDSGKPWFISFLTTTTHPPYNVPGIVEPSRKEALSYADKAIKVLVDGLRQRNLLENTVVIVTSDEGREISGRKGFLNDLALNRLPFVVIHPDIKELVISNYTHNTDVRNITLSLLNPIDKDKFMSSLPVHNHVMFGNVITGKVFWYVPEKNNLVACWTHNFYCEEWKDREELFISQDTSGAPLRLPEFRHGLEQHDHRSESQ